MLSDLKYTHTHISVQCTFQDNPCILTWVCAKLWNMCTLPLMCNSCALTHVRATLWNVCTLSLVNNSRALLRCTQKPKLGANGSPTYMYIYIYNWYQQLTILYVQLQMGFGLGTLQAQSKIGSWRGAVLRVGCLVGIRGVVVVVVEIGSPKTKSKTLFIVECRNLKGRWGVE
jgi:hypothetical protein